MDGTADRSQAVITPSEIAAILARGQGRGFAPGLAGLGGLAADPGGFQAADFLAAARLAPEAMTTDAAQPLADPGQPPMPQARPGLSFAEPPPPLPPRDIAAELAAARAEGRAEGHAEGLATGLATGRAQAEAELRASALAELTQARALFLSAVTALSAPEPAAVRGLEQALAAAVARLASDRAGQAIADHPGPFLARIAALADRVAQAGRSVTIALHPADLAALGPHLPGGLPEGAQLAADAALSQGDVVLRAGGITLSDLLAGEAVA